MLGDVHCILQQMRELAGKAANGSTIDRAAGQNAITVFLRELNIIGAATRSAIDALFAGDTAQTFNGNADPGSELSVTAALAVHQPDIFGVDVGTVNIGVDADSALTSIERAIDSVCARHAMLGGIRNRLERDIATLTVAMENLSASESHGWTIDMAMEMLASARSQIAIRPATALAAQANRLTMSDRARANTGAMAGSPRK